MSVSRGGGTLEAIGVVCNLDGTLNVLEGLDALLAQSLLIESTLRDPEEEPCFRCSQPSESEAAFRYKAVLAQCHEREDKAGMMDALNQLGALACSQGDWVRAMQYGEEGQAIDATPPFPVAP